MLRSTCGPSWASSTGKKARRERNPEPLPAHPIDAAVAKGMDDRSIDATSVNPEKSTAAHDIQLSQQLMEIDAIASAEVLRRRQMGIMPISYPFSD